ncbi:MAG: hypothetical protein WD768_18385 [Phycisphaeraceae bacterium]
MRIHSALTFIAALCLLVPSVACAAPYEPSAQAGPREVITQLDDWIDAKRSDRKVPVKIHYPKGTDACPVVIFSHGLGGSREGYEMHGQFWASHGFVSVHVQHAGSDDEVWRGVPPRDIMAAMRKATADPQAIINRPKDVSFAIDTLEKLNRTTTSPLHKRLDLNKLGMAGHSFGSWTTLAVGGLSAGPLGQAGLDKRIKAMIPMSSPVVKAASQRDAAYGKIAIPALHMTGTLDDSPIGDTDAKDRRIPFDHSPGPKDSGADCFLITFDGGDHMVFSGAKRTKLGARLRGNAGASDGSKDEAMHKIIKQSSLAFLDAYLHGKKDAVAWLQKDSGLKAALGKLGTLEMKKE